MHFPRTLWISLTSNSKRRIIFKPKTSVGEIVEIHSPTRLFLSQNVQNRFTVSDLGGFSDIHYPRITFAGTHSYTPGWREALLE